MSLRQVRYSLFIAALEECSKDNLDFVKDKSIKVRQSQAMWHMNGHMQCLSQRAPLRALRDSCLGLETFCIPDCKAQA